jgi:DNA-binding CsgD family transcriptional regulator
LIDLEAGVMALEQLDDTDARTLQRVTTEHEPILGVQGRATLAQWLAGVGRFHDAASVLRDWNDPARETSADAHRTRGVIASYLGEPARARHWFHRSRAVYEARNDRAQAGDDIFHELLDVQIPYAADERDERQQLSSKVQSLWSGHDDAQGSYWAAQSFEAVESMIGGQWSSAAACFERQRNLPAFRTSPFITWWLRLARLRGETRPAWAAIRSELPDGPATEPFGRTYAVLSDLLLIAADLALDAADLEQGKAWLEAHDRLLARSGAVRGQAENRLAWARYFQLDGDQIAACTAARAALDHAANPRQPFALIAAKRFTGTLSDCGELTAHADRHLSDALALADACGAPFERALTLLVLADRRIDTGNLDEAQRLITEARSICLPLQAEPALTRLSELEERLVEQSAGEPPGGLSQREAEVLRLVAQGLSDAEVAERLFIARRTVNSHLTSIYTKLDVSSRVAATRFAVEHGLT